MKVKKGQTRIVFLFPLIGIVIKIPIIRIFRAISPFFYLTPSLRGRRLKFFKKYVGYPVDAGEFKWSLFDGICCNTNEYWFYKRTKNIFLQPTYFCLFGFLNIQKYGKVCELGETDFWCQLYELTNGRVFDSPHHFANPNNFCFCNGELRILDYGNCRTHGVILQYGEKIIKSFNPAYSWEEEKKKFKKEIV